MVCGHHSVCCFAAVSAAWVAAIRREIYTMAADNGGRDGSVNAREW